jgi:hypothetical protein
MSALGQKQTFTASLEHFVGQLQKGFGYRETESFSPSEIEDELELVGRLRRQIAG